MSKWEQRRDDDETRLAEEASCHFGPCMGPKTTTGDHDTRVRFDGKSSAIDHASTRCV